MQVSEVTAYKRSSAVEALPHARGLRIVALVNNPCVVDARVIREAEALASAGHDVHVFAHSAAGLPTEECVEGVHFHRFRVRQSTGPRETNKKERDKGQNIFRVVGRSILLSIAPILYVLRLIAYWLLPRIIEFSIRFLYKKSYEYYELTVRYFKGRRKKFQKLNRDLSHKSRTVFNKLSRFIITGTTAELLRHARAYNKPAIDLKPDVVHAHDLYTLLAGYLIARRTGAKLIYDSHELEIGRNGNFSVWELWMRARTERFLINRADAVITVCDSIADYLAELYNIPRPTVIHNAPSVKAVRKGAPDVRSRLGLSKNTPIALYVGSVTINRGLEECVQALPYAKGVHLVCVGPRRKPTEEIILAEAERLGVTDRLHLVDPVPHDEVTSFVRTSDVSLITIQDVCLSYRFCFPNKLLESLLTGLPIVVSRLVELERIVEMTGSGVVVDETDPSDIARGINEILSARDKFVPTPAMVRKLKNTYSLEVQMDRLVGLYDGLMPASSGALTSH